MRLTVGLWCLTLSVAAPSVQAELVDPVSGNYRAMYESYQQACPITAPQPCGALDLQIFVALQRSVVPDLQTAEKIAQSYINTHPLPEAAKNYALVNTRLYLTHKNKRPFIWRSDIKFPGTITPAVTYISVWEDGSAGYNP